MYDPRAWRALARGPEYIPPHTSIHQGAPIRPPPPYPAPTAEAPASASTPSSHIQGPPSPTTSKLSRPQGFASSSPSTSKSPNGKFGGGHRYKPHLVFPLDARPVRAAKTLTKLLDKLEDDQKRDIHTRISGHLNHDKVFEGLVKASENGSDGQQTQRRGRRGRPAAADNMPASVITIPVTPPNASTEEESKVFDPFPRPHTPPRSKSRHAVKQFTPAHGSPIANDVISAVIHKKIRNPDRASLLYHQYMDEVQVEPTPLGKMHVASRYFDVLIQDFRLFAPLLSGIKTAYHDVIEQYITDLNELEALKRGLIVSIGTSHSARHVLYCLAFVLNHNVFFFGRQK
ncbi:hypothetical protein BCR44DRAFT_1193768 [Catenaria anguillulae PL171]|uniref:Uncharacterized protein n=1 Tax=Catenaria anguillulae PL171 TaxID=765915 RepID=A0A1Y2HG62_9FUNG|nr:hypothetical protein BCR44DRAFT_1193768 [Catenaria anguillulae PL171]